jgi:hypothetical protein
VSFPAALRVSPIKRQNVASVGFTGAVRTGLAAGAIRCGTEADRGVGVGFPTVVVTTTVVVCETVVAASGGGVAAPGWGAVLYDGPPQPASNKAASAVPKLTRNDRLRSTLDPVS